MKAYIFNVKKITKLVILLITTMMEKVSKSKEFA